MDALYPRYAKFIRSGDNVVLESGSSSFGVPPMMLQEMMCRCTSKCYGAPFDRPRAPTFGIALANPKTENNSHHWRRFSPIDR